MTGRPRLLAVGGAHIDRRGQVSGPYVPAASNPGTMREDIGGGVFNAVRCAVQRGVFASLWSLRGGDGAGDSVARAIEAAGLRDLSAVFLDRATPSYTALIDRDGELITGFADMSLYDLAFPKQMRRSKVRAAADETDAILCDANLPTAALRSLFDAAAHRPIHAIAVSPAKVVRLVPLLDRLSMLFMNRRECAAITGADVDPVAGLRDKGLRSGVVTGGNGPVLGFDGSGAFILKPPLPRHVADVTGAGDALTGATIAALLQGEPLRSALREGAAAAMLAIESANAVPAFTEADFVEALALVPEVEDVP